MVPELGVVPALCTTPRATLAVVVSPNLVRTGLPGGSLAVEQRRTTTGRPGVAPVCCTTIRMATAILPAAPGSRTITAITAAATGMWFRGSTGDIRDVAATPSLITGTTVAAVRHRTSAAENVAVEE